MQKEKIEQLFFDSVSNKKNKRLLSNIVDKRDRKSFYSFLNIAHLNI